MMVSVHLAPLKFKCNLPAFLLLMALFALLSAPAWAHSPITNNQEERLPTLVGAAVLVLLWAAYLLGARRVMAARRHWLTFNGVMLLSAFTVFGPLDEWAETSAAAHMTQHMLMMVIIAPLWVLARPLPQLLAVSPRKLFGLWAKLLRLAGYPMAAAIAHGAVIWFWHAPRFYVLALENPWWHVVEHVCFLGTAALFWWAVLRSSQPGKPYALLALLFTLMHTGFLGALLTFANAPLYGADRSLSSQQLAGLIMWVLGGIPYLLAAAWVGMRWFQQMMRRSASALAVDRREGR